MATFKMKLCRFVRTVAMLDMRATADAQEAKRIKTKARRYEVLKHTAGYRSSFIRHDEISWFAYYGSGVIHDFRHVRFA